MKINIVGAGPAGLLLAQHLLNQQQSGVYYDIHIFEKGPDPTTTAMPAFLRQSLHPVAIQERGMAALQEIPGLLDGSKFEDIPSLLSQGQWINEFKVFFENKNKNGKNLKNKSVKPKAITKPHSNFVIPKNKLVQSMTQFLKASSKDQVRSSLNFHFDTTVDDILLQNQNLVARKMGGEAKSFPFDYLVGADGTNSKVRSSICSQKQFDLEVDQETVGGWFLPFQIESEHYRSADQLKDWNGLCGWMAGDFNILLSPPIGNDQPMCYGMLACSNDDKLPAQHLRDLDFFRQHFPSFVPLLEKSTTAMESLQKTPYRLSTVRCNHLIAGKDSSNPSILLLGDASHTFSAALNQGLNAALEDVSIFAECLERQHSIGEDMTWSRLLQIYDDTRIVDIDAAHELSNYAMPATSIQKMEFLCHMVLKQNLPAHFQQFLPELPLDLIHRSDLSYSEVLSRCSGWVERVKTSMLQKEKMSEDDQKGISIRRRVEAKQFILKRQG